MKPKKVQTLRHIEDALDAFEQLCKGCAGGPYYIAFLPDEPNVEPALSFDADGWTYRLTKRGGMYSVDVFDTDGTILGHL